jgi:predicted nucleotidyltransferase
VADEGEDYCRPATLDDLKLVLQALNESRVEYLLIGGYALAAHGYVRATTDIDILVPATIEAGNKIKRALLMLPQKVSAEIDPEWFAEGETIRVADEFVVDVMFNACGETFASLTSEVEVIDLDGIPVKTVSLAGLLRTKQTVRSKDVLDRLILERAIEKLKE